MCGVLLVCLLPAHLKTAPGVADGNEEPYLNVHAQLPGLLVTSAPAPHPRMPICLQADDAPLETTPQAPQGRHRRQLRASSPRQVYWMASLAGVGGATFWAPSNAQTPLGAEFCRESARRRRRPTWFS